MQVCSAGFKNNLKIEHWDPFSSLVFRKNFLLRPTVSQGILMWNTLVVLTPNGSSSLVSNRCQLDTLYCCWDGSVFVHKRQTSDTIWTVKQMCTKMLFECWSAKQVKERSLQSQCILQRDVCSAQDGCLRWDLVLSTNEGEHVQKLMRVDFTPLFNGYGVWLKGARNHPFCGPTRADHLRKSETSDGVQDILNKWCQTSGVWLNNINQDQCKTGHKTKPFDGKMVPESAKKY